MPQRMKVIEIVLRCGRWWTSANRREHRCGAQGLKVARCMLFLVANLGGKSQEPLLELRFPLDDKEINASVVVTETEELVNQEVMVGLIVLLAVGFILAKLPKT